MESFKQEIVIKKLQECTLKMLINVAAFEFQLEIFTLQIPQKFPVQISRWFEKLLLLLNVIF